MGSHLVVSKKELTTWKKRIEIAWQKSVEKEIMTND